MSHLQATRGIERDLPFELKDQAGGSLQDNWNFTDGLTGAQWPIVKVFTLPDGAGTDITADVVKDITADTIASATHKHPDGTTGIWRKAQGAYRVRIVPDVTLALDTYYLRISFEPANGSTYVEDHELEIVLADISFGTAITADDIAAGVVTTLTDPEIEAIIAEATDDIDGMLDACGIDLSTFADLPKRVRSAIIAQSRAYVLSRDPGSRVATELREGNRAIKYSTSNAGLSSEDYFDKARQAVEDFCHRYSQRKRPKVQVTRQLPGDGAFVDDGLLGAELRR